MSYPNMDGITDSRQKIVHAMETFKKCEQTLSEVLHIWDLKFLPETSITFGLETFSLNGLLIHIHKVKDMLPVMDFIERLCTELKCKVRMTDDYPEVKRRSFHLTKPIVVSAFLDEDSPNCKFVKRGTKTEDVYEFVCPDSAIPAGNAP